MTLREFKMAVNAYRENEKKEYFRVGMVCTMVARLGGNKKVKPEDFVPKEKRPEMTPEQMEKQAELWTKMLGGEVRR